MSSKELIKEMNRLCLQHGTSFYCCMLTNDKETDDVVVYCKQNSINFYQYKVDLFCADNTFLPIDPHPNNEGHKKMFREIDSLLKVIHYDKK